MVKRYTDHRPQERQRAREIPRILGGRAHGRYQYPDAVLLKGSSTRSARAASVCVEVEGMERLVAACDNAVAEGMVVSHELRQGARGAPHEPAVSFFHTMMHRARTARAAATARLQQLANDFNLRGTPFAKKLRAARRWTIPLPAHSRQRQVRQVHALHPGVRQGAERAASGTSLGTGSPHDRRRVATTAAFRTTDCTLCGQCITHCPTAALRERDDTGRVFDAI